MTRAELLLVAEAEAVVDVAVADSAPSVILITVGAVLEVDAVVEILELTAEVVVIEVDVVEDDVADDVADVVDSLGFRNFESMLDASPGETVVVVVEAAEGITVTVTVTIWPDEVIVFEADVVAEDEVEEVIPDVDVALAVELDSVATASDPVMPPVTPAALIRARTLLSLLQIRAVPGARTSGIAKHR
jgi:hypothetical protein